MRESSPAATGQASLETRAELLALLFRQSYPAAYVSILVAALLTVLLWSTTDHGVLMVWYGSVLYCGLMRLVLFRHYRTAPPEPQRVPLWEKLYFATLLLYFMVWGIGGVWIMPVDSQLHQLVVLYFLIGMAGSAVSVFSANRIMLATAVTLLLVPSLLWMFIQGDPLYAGVGLAGTVFVLAALRSSRVLAAAMRQNLELKNMLVHAKQQAEDLARVDELTGIFNRRAFYEWGEKMAGQSRRRDDDLSAIMLDVDYFKRINDEHGHRVGDEALRHLARLLSTSLRESDICGRIGGEEFAVLLPDTRLLLAVEVAEKLRLKIANTPLTYRDREYPLTVSLGVAQDNDSLERLLMQADAALYRAKSAGRDRVEPTLSWDLVADPPGQSPGAPTAVREVGGPQPV